MNYIKITPLDVADGPGCRVTLWVSGCRNHCLGCHNKDTWDFASGQLFTKETLSTLLDDLRQPYIRGLTICGGEPMEEENQAVLLNVVKTVKQNFPSKDIWCYTGYLYEDLLDGGKRYFECTDALLALIDVLVDGPFVISQRDISDANRWRGSRNQRVIDVQKSLKNGRASPLGKIPNNIF